MKIGIYIYTCDKELLMERSNTLLLPLRDAGHLGVLLNEGDNLGDFDGLVLWGDGNEKIPFSIPKHIPVLWICTQVEPKKQTNVSTLKLPKSFKYGNQYKRFFRASFLNTFGIRL